MKRNYMNPQMRVVELRHQSHLLNASRVGSTNAPLNYRGSDADIEYEDAR